MPRIKKPTPAELLAAIADLQRENHMLQCILRDTTPLPLASYQVVTRPRLGAVVVWITDDGTMAYAIDPTDRARVGAERLMLNDRIAMYCDDRGAQQNQERLLSEFDFACVEARALCRKAAGL